MTDNPLICVSKIKKMKNPVKRLNGRLLIQIKI